ncbi:TRP75-related protein, partial [Anaplasma bovis]|uniref:TRP75-related protein n=1 Tax=Anaplasma bovis TaxID=186733 RepID=UPI002FF32E16
MRSGVFWYGMEGFVSIFRRFSLSIGCTLRLVVMCVSLLGLTSCFVGKYAFEMSRNYRPVYNPGGHLFEEDEDFARSYELYKKRREDLQNSGDSAAHSEQKKKRLTEAEKRKVVSRLRRHGVKVAAADDNKGDMVNNEGIDLSRVRGARFIDVDVNEIAKLKAKSRTKAGATEADQQIGEKGANDQKESLEEGTESQLPEGVNEQDVGANAADKDGQQQGNVDELEPGTVGDEGEDFFESEEDEDRQDADISGLEPGSATADNKSTADDEGEDFLGEDGDQQYAD